MSDIKTAPIHAVDSPGATVMKRILIVDDESLIRYSLSASLRRDDIHIKAVECGKDALSEINHIFYDICFLDINLPDINGLVLMKTIKQSSPATKIIIMTAGSVDDPEMQHSIQVNANLFLPKPFNLDHVKLFVEGFIGHGMSIHRSEEQSYSVSEREPFETRPMEAKKRRERREVMLSTTCAMVASDNGQGEKKFIVDILEISETGMCIRTEYLLKPGQRLRFGHNPELSTGVVRWSKGGRPGDSYRSGIQFVMLEEQSNQPLLQALAGGDG